MTVKKAIIVAAGLSSRLYPLTLEVPKGLLPICNTTLLSRSIALLNAHGIEDISLVVGYKNELLREKIGSNVRYILNPFYTHCNNMGSLWFAKDVIGEDPFVYLHGDIIYDRAILTDTLDEFQNSHEDLHLVTEFGPVDEEAMKVQIENGVFIRSDKAIPLSEAAGEWIGLAYCRRPALLWRHIEAVMMHDGLKYYDTYAFTSLAADGYLVRCSSTQGRPWVEIDFLEDYERAKLLFGK